MNLKISKSPKMAFSQQNFLVVKNRVLGKFHFGGFSNFQIQIILSFLVSHQKNIFFSLSKHIFVLPKKFWADSIKGEEDIL
jgi:hypothetical protein